MTQTGTPSRTVSLAKASCVLVIALMLASFLYVTITALSQYGNIGV